MTQSEINTLKSINKRHVRDAVNHRRQVRAMEHDIYLLAQDNPDNEALHQAWKHVTDYMKEINLIDEREIRKQYETIYE